MTKMRKVFLSLAGLAAMLYLQVPVAGFAFAGLGWAMGLGGLNGFLFAAAGGYWGAVAGIAVATAGVGAVVGFGIGM